MNFHLLKDLQNQCGVRVEVLAQAMAKQPEKVTKARRVSSKLWKEQEDAGVNMCMCRIFDIDDDDNKKR